LDPQIVHDLAGILQLSDKAFIVGGQALNLWAERYSAVGELSIYGPFTSKDIDYFGHREAAQKLADALNGTVRIPIADDHTPQTAIVLAQVGGHQLAIDFLGHIKGVDQGQMEKQAVELNLTVRAGKKVGALKIPIMHPFHCMQSRLANVVELGRETDLAHRQLDASPIVLREFLSDMLATGGHKHVTSVLQALYDYLLTDTNGRKAHKRMKNDPAAILDYFQDDARLDLRWREMSLASMRRTIAVRRTAWGAMRATLLRVIGRDSAH
jgi:hypothetical protein